MIGHRRCSPHSRFELWPGETGDHPRTAKLHHNSSPYMPFAQKLAILNLRRMVVESRRRSRPCSPGDGTSRVGTPRPNPRHLRPCSPGDLTSRVGTPRPTPAISRTRYVRDHDISVVGTQRRWLNGAERPTFVVDVEFDVVPATPRSTSTSAPPLARSRWPHQPSQTSPATPRRPAVPHRPMGPTWDPVLTSAALRSQ